MGFPVFFQWFCVRNCTHLSLNDLYWKMPESMPKYWKKFGHRFPLILNKFWPMPPGVYWGHTLPQWGRALLRWPCTQGVLHLAEAYPLTTKGLKLRVRNSQPSKPLHIGCWKGLEAHLMTFVYNCNVKKKFFTIYLFSCHVRLRWSWGLARCLGCLFPLFMQSLLMFQIFFDSVTELFC